MTTVTMDETRMIEASIIVENLTTNPKYYIRKINNIDGVKVDVYLNYIERREKIYYTISLDTNIRESQNIMYSSKLFEGALSCELIYSILINLRETLPKLKYDKTIGVFSKNIFEDFDDFMDNIDECCVCLCKTSAKGSCKHFLCLQCWSSLEHLDKKNCPICREILKSDDESDFE